MSKNESLSASSLKESSKKEQLRDEITELKAAIDSDPNDVESRVKLAVVLQEKDEIDLAKAQLNEAVRINPEYAEAHFRLGLISGDLDDLEPAITSFKEAIRINLDYAEAHYHLGLTFSMQSFSMETLSIEEERNEKVELAIAEFKEAIRISPTHVGANISLAMTLSEYDSVESGIAVIEKAISLNPNEAGFYNCLGFLLKQIGSCDEAIAAYQKAVSLDPQDASNYRDLGEALSEIDIRQEEAKKALEKAKDLFKLQKDPVEVKRINGYLARIHVRLGRNLEEQNKLTEAIVEYREAVSLNPDYARHYIDLGRVLRRAGKRNKAKKAITKAKEIFEAEGDFKNIKEMKQE